MNPETSLNDEIGRRADREDGEEDDVQDAGDEAQRKPRVSGVVAEDDTAGWTLATYKESPIVRSTSNISIVRRILHPEGLS
jgi:hypothetical protein